MDHEARHEMCDQLNAVGFSDVTMLSKARQPSDAAEPGARVVVAA